MAKHASLLAALLLSSIPSAHALLCAPLNPTVKLAFTEPTLDRSLDAPALHLTGSNIHLSSHEIIVGLYNAALKIEVNNTTITQNNPLNPARGSTTCFFKFDVAISLSPIIHILHQIAPGSCAEQVVWAHEYNHHLIEIAKINEALPYYFLANPLSLQPFAERTRQESTAAAQAYANAYVAALKQSLSNFIQPAQEAFDSPAEYSRFKSICPADFSKISANNQPPK